MSTATEATSLPWQPLTFGGVATFAHASLKRLLLVQLVVAILAAVGTVLLLAHGYTPVISQAIAGLPDSGYIQRGELAWGTNAPTQLVDNPFLSIAIDPEGKGGFNQTSDVQLELNQHQFKVHSLFGSLLLPYPEDWKVALNHAEAEPWWGAWEPFLLLGAGLGTVLGLFAIWAVMATCYSVPARLMAYFSERNAGWRACWKLCGAALMPGALLFTLGILLYAFGHLPLVALLFVVVLHVLTGWIYVVGSVFRVPRTIEAAAAKANPFQPPAPPAPEPKAGEPAAPENKPPDARPPNPNPFH